MTAKSWFLKICILSAYFVVEVKSRNVLNNTGKKYIIHFMGLPVVFLEMFSLFLQNDTLSAYFVTKAKSVIFEI